MRHVIRKYLPSFLVDCVRVGRTQYRRIMYKGDKLLCPCCKSSFREFAPYGYANRPHARCPNCGSGERHRLLWLYLEQRTRLFEDRVKVLHFAPECFLYEMFSKLPNIDYHACDLNPDRYSKGVHKMDITDIDYLDNTFDVILCIHVLEHISDDKKAMSELYRVLKKGGFAILQVPVDINLERTYEDFTITTRSGRSIAFGHPEHVRVYGRDYKDRLESIGFNVKADDFVKSLSPEDQCRYVLTKDEEIYVCTK